MADESNLGAVAGGRALRWAAFFALVVAAAVLYYRDGRRLAPFAATPAAADTTR
jgi:hypothetical protein